MAGLTYSHHPEPALAELTDASKVASFETISDEGSGTPVHMIEGENVYALARMVADGVRADVVYADLPYNTGDASGSSNAMSVLTYVDRRDSQDDFEHSGWLSFIESRVRLSHAILRRTGVAIFAIGRDELAPLILLLEDIFGSRNRVAIVTWQGGVKSHSRFISNSSDYMVIVAKDLNELKRRKVKWRKDRDGAAEIMEMARKCWEESGGDHALAQAKYRRGLRLLNPAVEYSYYRYLDDQGRVFRTSDMGATVARASRPRRPIVHPSGEECPVPAKGWAISDERMDWLLENGRIFFSDDPAVIPKQITYLDETKAVLPDSFSLSRGTAQKDLNAMIGTNEDGSPRFYAPKDVGVLERWISAVIPDFRLNDGASEPIVVVDPFAGSASTGEAVLRIAARTGGIYEAYCITTNENNDSDDPERGVVRYVALPRLTAAITGEWAAGRRPAIPGRVIYQRVIVAPGDDPGYEKVRASLVRP